MDIPHVVSEKRDKLSVAGGIADVSSRVDVEEVGWIAR